MLRRLAQALDSELSYLTQSDMVSYAVVYGEFLYKADSWAYPRRVVCKIEKPCGQMLHMNTFVVTNMESSPEYNGPCNLLKEGAQTMSYKTYTSEFKAKVVIEVLQGEKSLSEIASQYNLNPNMVRNWKSEFLENASMIFENPKKAEKAARRKEEALKKEKETMLKTIGQLTIERDFLQDCFRRSGRPVPELDPEKR